jgi:coproporphyrinogen III oxidase-like Fe-S oxidoreductase
MWKYDLNLLAFINSKVSGGNVQYPPNILWWEIKKDNIYKAWSEYIKDIYPKHKNIWIYIHTPYCESKCVFCECLSKKIEVWDKLGKYLEKLFSEIDFLKEIFKDIEFDSIYFGWGTPSIYNSKQLEKLFSKLHEEFKFKKDYQINFESSPITLNEDKFKVLSKYSVERITLWVQTMTESALKVNDRKQTWNMIKNVFKWKSQYNIKYVNIDLISWLPWDNMKDFLLNLKKLISFKPDMFHIYPFRPTENTRYVKGGNIYSKLDMKVRDHTYNLWKAMIEKAWYFWVKNDSWGLEEWAWNKQEIEKIVNNCSVLWFWSSAHSQVFSKLTYVSPESNDYKWIDSKFFWLWIDKLDSSIKYIISHFRNGFDINTFNSLFDIIFEKQFEKELIFLAKYNMWYIENWYFKTNIKNVFEKLLYSKIFFKEEYIDYYKKKYNYDENHDYVTEFKNFISDSFK